MRTGTGIKLAIVGLTIAVAAGPAAAQTSAYKTPASGNWKVQDKFENTAGGSATIAKGGAKLTKLSANVGSRNAQEGQCGTTKTLELSKSLPIKRVGSYKRPVVGRLGKDKLIASTKTTLKVDGVATPGTALVIFEKTGRQAFTVELKAGTCKLDFAIRK